MSSYDLDRFVAAQDGVYAGVIEELSAGHKRSHWMWFIFPQIAGLGSSLMAQRYAIGSVQEARSYFAHDLLGPRLIECTRLILAVPNRTITDILGQPDDVKFRSSMTLFSEASQHRVFADAITMYFPAGSDARTLEILKSNDLNRLRDHDQRGNNGN